jgi:hypothetical protein
MVHLFMRDHVPCPCDSCVSLPCSFLIRISTSAQSCRTKKPVLSAMTQFQLDKFFATVLSTCTLQEAEFSLAFLHNYTSKTNGTPSFMVAIFWYTLYEPIALQSLYFVKYSQYTEIFQ